MSAEELEARIVELDAEIDTQKELLRQLESTKIGTKRRLNAIRDPLARLPLEISSEIFLQCLPSCPIPESAAALALLLRICNTWSTIALSTPALWATVYLDGRADVEVVESWLQRAGRFPLSIFLHGKLQPRVAGVLPHYLPALPRLESLTIASPYSDPWGQFNTLGLEHIMRLFRCTPNLVRCTFLDIHVPSPPASENPQILILPNLRCLKFMDENSEQVPGCRGILNKLSLPSLETLIIPLYKISLDTFSLFLERCTPPLRRLVINEGSDNVRLSDLLPIVPFLTDFELDIKLLPLAGGLFAAFAGSDPLLPNLQSLKIRCFYVKDNHLHDTVLRMLSARRSKLVRFHLVAQQPRPDADVCDGLRLVASDGMEIFIADENGNYYFKENCASDASAAEERVAKRGPRIPQTTEWQSMLTTWI
ncbi:hypothetical protein K438DRAFT_1226965 [Mycena galopus ATCC 62051]|nr:hypothetical protein K438DRAFT_1226965 [Mycena galopus ATCC 62051]